MSENRIQKYFIRPVRIVGMELPVSYSGVQESFSESFFLDCF